MVQTSLERIYPRDTLRVEPFWVVDDVPGCSKAVDAAEESVIPLTVELEGFNGLAVRVSAVPSGAFNDLLRGVVDYVLADDALERAWGAAGDFQGADAIVGEI